jgi:hypothetical protein
MIAWSKNARRSSGMASPAKRAVRRSDVDLGLARRRPAVDSHELGRGAAILTKEIRSTLKRGSDRRP